MRGGSQTKHKLRVCNAYPAAEAVDLFRARESLTKESGPLPYKSCHDFSLTLKPGDQIDFRLHAPTVEKVGTSGEENQAAGAAGAAGAAHDAQEAAGDLLGTFTISESLEASANSLLFLGVFKHDTLSSAVQFASHVFADLGRADRAQVAVLDLYKGVRSCLRRPYCVVHLLRV